MRAQILDQLLPRPVDGRTFDPVLGDYRWSRRRSAIFIAAAGTLSWASLLAVAYWLVF